MELMLADQFTLSFERARMSISRAYRVLRYATVGRKEPGCLCTETFAKQWMQLMWVSSCSCVFFFILIIWSFSNYSWKSSCPWLLRSPDTDAYDLMDVSSDWEIWVGIIDGDAKMSVTCDECTDRWVISLGARRVGILEVRLIIILSLDLTHLLARIVT